MKYKVGDTVKIKSIDWFNAQEKDSGGDIHIYSVNNIVYFTKDMSNYCSKEAKIEDIRIDDNIYFLDVDKRCYEWTDEMLDENYIFEELPIGEVFDFKGHKLRVEKDVHGSCAGCFMLENYRIKNCCAQLFEDRLRPRCGSMRKDRTGVIFKEIENMEKRKVELDIETAKKWYNGNDNSLRTIALQAYTEDELKHNELPNTWEEFCKNYHNCEEDSFVGTSGNIVTCSKNHGRSSLYDKNLLPNKKYAEGILALCQLTQLRDCYRQGLVPDWNSCEDIKYSIVVQYNKITSLDSWHVQSFLSFQTSEIRDKFLNNFKDLIELAKEYI